MAARPRPRGYCGRFLTSADLRRAEGKRAETALDVRVRTGVSQPGRAHVKVGCLVSYPSLFCWWCWDGYHVVWYPPAVFFGVVVVVAVVVVVVLH